MNKIVNKTTAKNAIAHWAGSVAWALLTLGILCSQSALATGIYDTKHNLGSTGTGTNKFSGTADLCVFCHTPHGADTSAAAPLWNRVISGTTYTTYNSLGTSSLDGATVAVGSVSIACLSCHDGTQAMNVMINQPGTGGYDSAGSTLAGTWSGTHQTAGKIINYTAAGAATGSYALIGTDLRNDHPIGIQYGGGPRSTSIPAAGSPYTTFKDPDFNTAQSQSLNGTQIWWIDTGTSGRQKTDISLYTRTQASYTSGTSSIASTVAQPYVECASCHDPHSTNTTFLRIANTGSAVCLACHIK